MLCSVFSITTLLSSVFPILCSSSFHKTQPQLLLLYFHHSALMSTRSRPLHTAAIAFLLIAYALSSTQHSDARSVTDHKLFSEGTQRRVLSLEHENRVARRLIGPGSFPPSCRWKCGRCAPCRPVHVPIQPGLNKPLEYYPEAWRCKCSNRLFMP